MTTPEATNTGESMKMYILVRRSIPLGFAINSVAHVATEATLRWSSHYGGTELYSEWWEWHERSGRIVTCGVTDDEFERAKETARATGIALVIFVEPDLDDTQCAMALFPFFDGEWPEFFRTLKVAGEVNFAKHARKEQRT